MAEGRTYIPVIDRDRCSECGVCLDACPATVIPEYREEKDSLRGIIYGRQIEEDHPDSSGTFPHCQQACPVHQDTRGYTQLIAQGRFEDAFSSILDTNPLPAVCGYICHHPCEEACIRGGVDDPIALRLLKRFAAEADMDQKKGMRSPAKLRSEKVLVVGSGPAGLAAANDLALIGYRVTVFEALPVLGGMLTVGIPSFRLPREIVDRDIARIKRLGVEMSENRMFRLDESVEGFSATFLAPGAHKGTRLTIPGAELEGVLSGVQFLRR
jgi:NADPH-dependent glutamate synthase beta subunit-like oxidoreductase